uniref:CHR5 n=1 Tax=Arundo donax TaxID=35708 RepID=A0A0A8XPW6_ARUDO
MWETVPAERCASSTNFFQTRRVDDM